MTEVISALINDKAHMMLNCLQDIGFTPGQAGRFLGETSSETLSILKDRADKFEFSTASEISLISMLMDKIDASAIGARVGIEAELANNGLQTILPSIVSTLATNRTNATELVTAMTTQRGLMKRIRGMFENVMGR